MENAQLAHSLVATLGAEDAHVALRLLTIAVRDKICLPDHLVLVAANGRTHLVSTTCGSSVCSTDRLDYSCTSSVAAYGNEHSSSVWWAWLCLQIDPVVGSDCNHGVLAAP